MFLFKLFKLEAKKKQPYTVIDVIVVPTVLLGFRLIKLSLQSKNSYLYEIKVYSIKKGLIFFVSTQTLISMARPIHKTEQIIVLQSIHWLNGLINIVSRLLKV